ncbi:MAG: hypothetical protein K9J12_06825 [Melioribacteraceae bacterium]|nr:hypothetical protein [Melioribacteraceae bacterium]
MRLKDVRENYNYYSQKTSDIIRQLNFAGIAIIWIFKTVGISNQSIPSELVLPAIFIIISLGLDLLQYISGSLVWGIYNRLKEFKKVKEDENFLAPRYFNWGTIFFFWSKILMLIVAYYFLLDYSYDKLIQ